MKKKHINLVWFKRDLRFIDHEPLNAAHQSGLPLLLVYIFEPSEMAYPDSDVRHWRFVYESLKEMNEKLKGRDAQIYIFHNEAQFVFESLIHHFSIQNIFSSEEIGNALTYERDKAMKDLFAKQHIKWKEYPTNGVIRKLKSRKNWEKRWAARMSEPVRVVDEKSWNLLRLEPEIYEPIKGNDLDQRITSRNKIFQEGGESWAWRYLDNFMKVRHVNYNKHISKPLLSRTGCSRLSPYLAYGNISMRMVCQYTNQHYSSSPNKKSFVSIYVAIALALSLHPKV